MKSKASLHMGDQGDEAREFGLQVSFQMDYLTGGAGYWGIEVTCAV